jgi:hypothetical protein
VSLRVNADGSGFSVHHAIEPHLPSGVSDDDLMSYCIAGEYRQVGGGSMTALNSGQTGTQLVSVHAVPVLPSGPASSAVCGYAYDRVHLHDDAWDNPVIVAGAPRCELCTSGTER